jgi:hypothetical protein
MEDTSDSQRGNNDSLEGTSDNLREDVAGWRRERRGPLHL